MESIENIRLRFAGMVWMACKRPYLFSPNGTIEELITFISSFDHGMMSFDANYMIEGGALSNLNSYIQKRYSFEERFVKGLSDYLRENFENPSEELGSLFIDYFAETFGFSKEGNYETDSYPEGFHDLKLQKDIQESQNKKVD